MIIIVGKGENMGNRSRVAVRLTFEEETLREFREKCKKKGLSLSRTLDHMMKYSLEGNCKELKKLIEFITEKDLESA